MKVKIVDVGKTQRAIDPKHAAESLGAEEVHRVHLVVKAYFDKSNKFYKMDIVSETNATLEELFRVVHYWMPSDIVCKSLKKNQRIYTVTVKSDGKHTKIYSNTDYGRAVGVILECCNRLEYELKNRTGTILMNKTSKKLKVWGGTDFFEGKQCRVIVAAATKKRAAELIKYSNYSFNTWMEETGNDIELAVATEEGVWYTKNEYSARTTKDYKRVEDKEL